MFKGQIRDIDAQWSMKNGQFWMKFSKNDVVLIIFSKNKGKFNELKWSNQSTQFRYHLYLQMFTGQTKTK